MSEKELIYLRPAEYADAMLLFQWRNDRETRANSLHGEKIVYEDHVRWLKSVLGTEKVKHFYILMVNNMPTGQIRLSIDQETALISYSIDVRFRARGYGRLILQMMEDKLGEENEHLHLVGYVKKENIASRRAFIALKYTECSENDLLRYEKRIGIVGRPRE